MTPATSWTESSVAGSTWTEDITAPGGFSGYALFGMPIPIENGVAMADATATWTEASGSATAFTEKNQSSTSWTEAGT